MSYWKYERWLEQPDDSETEQWESVISQTRLTVNGISGIYVQTFRAKTEGPTMMGGVLVATDHEGGFFVVADQLDEAHKYKDYYLIEGKRPEEWYLTKRDLTLCFRCVEATHWHVEELKCCEI